MRQFVRKTSLIVLGLLVLIAAQAGDSSALSRYGKELIMRAEDEYVAITAQKRLCREKGLTSYISGVGERLIAAAGSIPAEVKPRFEVLDEEEPYAFSMPNGVIFITTGAVFALKNEAQLAAVLAREVSHVTEGHYISIYEASWRAVKKRYARELVVGLTGIILEGAADFAISEEVNRLYEQFDAGELSYAQTMRRIDALFISQDVAYNLMDLYRSIPPPRKGNPSADPRLRAEVIADGQRVRYLVMAGYDPQEAPKAWQLMAKKRDKLHPPNPLLPQALEEQLRLFKRQMEAIKGYWGEPDPANYLFTMKEIPSSRPRFIEAAIRSQDIKALMAGRHLSKGEESFYAAIDPFLLKEADQAFLEERYEKAMEFYLQLRAHRPKDPLVAYRLGKCYVGDFAFAATEKERIQAERYYLEALRIDPTYAQAARDLAELYEEWERPEGAIKYYKYYLHLVPKAKDRTKVANKIRRLEQKLRRYGVK